MVHADRRSAGVAGAIRDGNAAPPDRRNGMTTTT
jgi:hypothetical protein